MNWRAELIRGLTLEERYHLLRWAAVLTGRATERLVAASEFRGTARVEFRRLLLKGYKPSKARYEVRKWVERKKR